MGFNFPNSPTDGTIYSPPGGPSYIFLNGVWVDKAGVVRALISDTPPVNPMPGQMWWESDTGNLYIWYDDGDSQQWVMVSSVSGSTGTVLTADTYNRLVNGAMQISQENGNTAGTTTLYFVADQWALQLPAGLSASGQRVYPSADTRVSPAYLGMVSQAAKTSLAATDYVMIQQRVEGSRIADLGWGTAAAMPVVLCFTANTTTPGTYAVAVRNAAGTRSYVIPVALTTTVQRFAFAIPGETTGVWPSDTSFALEVDFMGASGSTYVTPQITSWQNGNYVGFSGMANLFSAASQGINVGRVGLYADPLSTGRAPPWQQPDYASDFAACQRYYRMNLFHMYNAGITSGQTYFTTRPVEPQMRSTPTLSGVDVPSVSGFPAAIGSLQNIVGTGGGALTIRESRVANATITNGIFQSYIVANARL